VRAPSPPPPHKPIHPSSSWRARPFPTSGHWQSSSHPVPSSPPPAQSIPSPYLSHTKKIRRTEGSLSHENCQSRDSQREQARCILNNTTGFSASNAMQVQGCTCMIRSPGVLGILNTSSTWLWESCSEQMKQIRQVFPP
jgi:hypothetical protein